MAEVQTCAIQICSFFFQAEDGIRDRLVTGVQTCALPIYEKQLLFQNIAITTEKIQADKPLDKKEFMVMMQGYDKNMEKI